MQDKDNMGEDFEEKEESVKDALDDLEEDSKESEKEEKANDLKEEYRDTGDKESDDKSENESDSESSPDDESTQDGAEENMEEDDLDSENDEIDDNSNQHEKKKKNFRKKDKKDQQIEELNDKYQRLFAEFQNYRTRSEKEKSSMYEVGARSIIEKILPVIDNLERGIDSLSKEDIESPVGEGMNLIYKQMSKALEEMGVTVIDAKGEVFDPSLHNAVMHEENDELGENVVSEVLQKGYMYRDTVIRHSMVKVAN